MNFNLARHRALTAAILSLTVSASFWPSAVTAEESDGWKFRITPYFWALGVEGTTSALGNDIDFDASFSDLVDVLNYALSANMELSKGKLFFVLDPLIGEFESDFTGPGGGPVGGTVVANMLIMDLNVGYSVNDNFDLYAGARYFDQDIEVTPNLLPTIDLGADWTDFIIGVRVRANMSEKWSFVGKLDGAVAGDSDSAWYVQAVVARHFGTNKHLDLGWRYYDVDFDSGTVPTGFKWDVAHSGPVIGFSWEFGG